MPQDEKSIIRSLIEPEIALDELSYEDVDEGTSNSVNSGGGEGRGQKLANKVGNVFPLILINDYTVPEDQISKMVIDSTGFLPTITLTLEIGQPSTFLSTSMPKDGDRINLFIRARDDAFKPIRNDYLITSVATTKSVNEQGDGMKMTLLGELFVPTIHDEAIRSKSGTSFNVLQEIATDLGLGFATNDDSTLDEQVWICPNDTYSNWIKHIAESSWKDENSFYNVFIDVYYHLNFVNVNNQFSDSTEIDEALIDTLISQDTLEGENISTATSQKLFTNAEDRRGTNMFIQRYKLENNSSSISKRYGYKMHCEFFEHNTLEKWDIFAEPLIVQGSEEDKILLKGKAGENYYETQVKKRWAGLQYSLPEHNVHEKYLYAKVHNLMNKKELDKLKVHLEVPRANFNIYRGERIPCVFISTGEPLKGKFLQQEAEKEAAADDEQFGKAGAPTLDKFYSGFYMIQGMIFTYQSTNPNNTQERGNFTEDVVITRRTWPTP